MILNWHTSKTLACLWCFFYVKDTSKTLACFWTSFMLRISGLGAQKQACLPGTLFDSPSNMPSTRS